ncbi:hypothetical protein JOC54_000406 [Alkalihalobacillus xiaoxiensis]|uniref:Uncharacterized protein n=1 Tax=Shouchella xiaoxiensis TaxID=766895 RepID=A0ABS2SNT9_9BACI|nr:hypothetical protein [Shouchella xiaoxiensis]MBM7837175.1 hypothetical protein [Shouchella xiaoxiensis]
MNRKDWFLFLAFFLATFVFGLLTRMILQDDLNAKAIWPVHLVFSIIVALMFTFITIPNERKKK